MSHLHSKTGVRHIRFSLWRTVGEAVDFDGTVDGAGRARRARRRPDLPRHLVLRAADDLERARLLVEA